MRGYFAEGGNWIEDFLESAARGDLGAVDGVRAKALLGAGMLTFGYGDLLRSIRLLEEGLATYRRLGDQAGTAATVAMLGYIRRAQGDDERAEELSEEGLRLSRLLDDNRSAAISLNTLGHLARHRGDLDRAADLFGGKEVMALEPDLLVRNDTDGLDPGALEDVPYWVEVLYSDSMDAKICVDGRLEEARDISTDELLRVADEAAARVRKT